MRRPPPDPDPSVFPRVLPRFGLARPGGLAVTWIGHSTLVIEFDGATVLAEPIWGEHAAPLPLRQFKRWVRPPVPARNSAADRRRGAVAQPLRPPRRSHRAQAREAAARRRLVRAARSRASRPALRGAPRGGAGLVGRASGRRRADRRRAGSALHRPDPVRSQPCALVRLRDRAGSRSAYFAGDTAYHPDFTRSAVASDRSTSRSCRSAPTIRAGSCTSCT